MCAWSETVLHRFSNLDGAGPVGALIFDNSGNLFGVTITGGLNQGGTVYKLNSGNWAESISIILMATPAAASPWTMPATFSALPLLEETILGRCIS